MNCLPVSWTTKLKSKKREAFLIYEPGIKGMTVCFGNRQRKCLRKD